MNKNGAFLVQTSDEQLLAGGFAERVQSYHRAPLHWGLWLLRKGVPSPSCLEKIHIEHALHPHLSFVSHLCYLCARVRAHVNPTVGHPLRNTLPPFGPDG